MLKKVEKKRVNVFIPKSLLEEISMFSESRGISNVNSIRKFIGLGLKVEKALAKGGQLIQRSGDKDIELLLI